MVQPLMPRATATWLVDNTALSFEQIADFCNMHVLEVQALADGDAQIVGVSPVINGQVTEEDIKACEQDPSARLGLIETPTMKKAKETRYTPLARRHDRPNAIAWIIKYCPNLPDAKIIKVLRTTKKTIEAIKGRSHWNISNITPENPVSLGFCTQEEMDRLLKKYKDTEEHSA